MTFNYKRPFLYISAAYSLFGYIVSVVSHGMKGTNGPAFAAIFIFTLLALDTFLIRRRYSLSRMNFLNFAAILPFYFFSITLPLILTCPSPLSPVVAFSAFSLITFLPFMLITYLIRRVHNKMAALKGNNI